MKPTLVVLAAGMGSRYGGLKQIDSMGPHGETVLDYAGFDAIRAGFGKIVYVIRKDFEADFREKVGNSFAEDIEVDYAFQTLDDLPSDFSPPADRVKPWGTAHAVWVARDIVTEPFAVINADDFYGADSYMKAVQFLAQESLWKNQPDYALIAYFLSNTLSEHGGVNRGIVKSSNGELNSVEEILDIQTSDDNQAIGTRLTGDQTTIPIDSLVSMNFWLFSPQIFSQIEAGLVEFLTSQGQELKSECYIPTIVDRLTEKNEATCAVVSTNSSWFGVTYPDDKAAVVKKIKALVDQKAYPSPLF